MISIYVIKQSNNDFPVAAAYDEGTAIATVKRMNELVEKIKYNYTCVPMFFEPGTQVNIIAPAIPKEYLPKGV
jgi:hypothetical protein